MKIPVGICGRAGAGKDTVAGILISVCLTRGVACERIGLADKVKAICAELYGFSHEQCHGALKDTVDPRWGFTPRFAFQRMGTEVARTIHADTWVNYTLEKMRDGITFIPDVRFPNEAAAIRKAGGIIIGVQNYRVDAAVVEHSSEDSARALIETAEIRFPNHATIDALKYTVTTLFTHMLLLTGVPFVQHK